MSNTLWAALLAPFLGGAIWWLLMWPGRLLHDFLWRRVRNPTMRKLLFKDIAWIDAPRKPFDF